MKEKICLVSAIAMEIALNTNKDKSKILKINSTSTNALTINYLPLTEAVR
jgi:hypothetical protein